MPKYPSQIDTSSNLPVAVDNLTPVQASLFNKLRDAVISIEQELGVKPSASYSTVKSRIDSLEAIINNLEIVKLSGDLDGILNSPKVIGIQGFPISTATPELNDLLSWNGIAWVPLSVIDSLPISLTGASNTLNASHANKYLRIYHTSATDLIIPLNSSVAYKVGTIISAIQIGAGQVTIVPTGGVTINSPITLKARRQWSTFSLKKVDTDTWDLSGDLAFF